VNSPTGACGVKFEANSGDVVHSTQRVRTVVNDLHRWPFLHVFFAALALAYKYDSGKRSRAKVVAWATRSERQYGSVPGRYRQMLANHVLMVSWEGVKSMYTEQPKKKVQWKGTIHGEGKSPG